MNQGSLQYTKTCKKYNPENHSNETTLPEPSRTLQNPWSHHELLCFGYSMSNKGTPHHHSLRCRDQGVVQLGTRATWGRVYHHPGFGVLQCQIYNDVYDLPKTPILPFSNCSWNFPLLRECKKTSTTMTEWTLGPGSRKRTHVLLA